MKSKLLLSGLVLSFGLLAVGCGDDDTNSTVLLPGPTGPAGPQGAPGPNGLIPAPTLTSVTPSSGNGGGGTQITITGTNFVPGFTNVTVGGVAATITAITATSITATTGAGSTVGAQNVVVTTPGGSATLTGGFSNNNGVLFVGNSGDNNVLEFSNAASGNTAPFRTLTTANPVGKLTSSGGEIFVPHPTAGTVEVYASNAANGAAVLRTINGLGTPLSVSVSGGELYVSNTNQVRVYSKNSAGFPFPNRTILGFTNIRDVFGGGTNLWVAEPNRVVVLDGNGDGAVNPTREISGGSTGFSSVEAVAVFSGEVYVYDNGNNTIRVFPVAQNGGAAPTRTFPVTASAAGGDFVIFNNELYLALASANTVEVYNPSSGALLRTITNPNATFNAPLGITVDNTVSPP